MGHRFGALLLTLAVAGCGKPAALSVDHAWVRLPAVPGRPAAGYFTLRGGPADATLIAVRTMAASRSELHEGMADGMRPVGAVIVPAGTEIRFAPGGRHVMLFDVDPRLTAGKALTLDLVFADGRRLPTDAVAVAAADPPPP